MIRGFKMLVALAMMVGGVVNVAAVALRRRATSPAGRPYRARDTVSPPATPSPPRPPEPSAVAAATPPPVEPVAPAVPAGAEQTAPSPEAAKFAVRPAQVSAEMGYPGAPSEEIATLAAEMSAFRAHIPETPRGSTRIPIRELFDEPGPAAAPVRETVTPVAAEVAPLTSARAVERAGTETALPAARGAESYLEEGNVYFNVGQYSLALDRYSAAIELDDTLPAAFYNRANALTRVGDYPEAMADYDRALALEPGDADTLNNRGMLHLYGGDHALALSDFEAALRINPGDATVVVNRGLARLHSGDAGGALEDFATAAAVEPGDPAAAFGAAQAAAALGRVDDALRWLRQSLELDPSYARDAAGDERLASLQANDEFLRLLRDAEGRAGA